MQMNRKYFSFLAATLALIVGVGIPVSASFTDSMQAQTFEKMPQGEMLKKLNLSDTQMQQLKTIRENGKAAMQNSSQQLRQATQDMQNLMAGSATTDQIRSKFNEVQNLRQQVAKMQFEQLLLMRAVLTPQQRTQLGQAMAQYKGNMRQRMQERLQNRRSQ
jgi:periplasmic protein CpxP/Spy